MREFFASGHIVDLVLVMMAVEALALGVYFHATSRGISLADLLINLVSAMCLLFALRAALTGQSWPWIAAGLCASMLGHLIDLSRRWQRKTIEPKTLSAVRGIHPPTS